MSANSKSRFGFKWGTSSATTSEAPSPGANPTSTTTTSQTPAERKGDVNELRTLLSDPAVQKDDARHRDVLRRVLAMMTMGVDTSSLFTHMVLACVTKDLVKKKMLYLYICAYSETNSETAILAINTLQKDCKDESPLVRGLALRSLASLRLPQLTEYLVPTLKACLSDTAPYVRKTAILATLKLFRVSPETFRSMGLVDRLYGALRDNDGLVSTNALAVLQEVLVDDGGISVNKSVLYFLLNRMRDVSEWQQCLILDLALKYTPANEEEMFDIMNLLEERLRGTNSAVIIACSHVFLHLTQNLPAVHGQVFQRLKEPLLTIMATSQSAETSYAVLCHIKLLVERDPKAFLANFKDFYCRHTDPSYIKSVRMDILASVASETSAKEIITELVAYVSDQNQHISRHAIQCICKIALRLDCVAKQALDHFLELLQMDVEHVRGETLVMMKSYLRKYTLITTVRPFLECIVKIYKEMAFEDSDSKVAFVWVLGEFGEHIPESPYLLETIGQDLSSETHALRIEVLTSLMKLFFKRPPEVQPILASVFSQLINDFSHADVHDRALLYYRLLRVNPRAASEVVCAPKTAVTTFAEDDTSEMRDQLFEEFNTLSVIFHMPSSHFIKTNELVPSEADEEEEEASESEDKSEADEKGLLSRDLKLTDEAAIEPPEFQRKWAKLETSCTFSLRLKAVPASSLLEEMLEQVNIMTLACGQQGTLLKLYLFAQPQDEADLHFLAEVGIQSTGNVQVTVKSEDDRTNSFVDVLKATFAPMCVQ